MTDTQRFTWRVEVDDREGDRDLRLTGGADDDAELLHALLAAVGDARRHFGVSEDPVPDEEDAWELRATKPPPTPARKPG
jgi:hypothetical protein